MILPFVHYAVQPDHLAESYKSAASAYSRTGLDITADAVEMPCGYVNAAYIPMLDTIVVCEEDADLSEPVQRFIIAHEIAHAVMSERGLDDTEPGADELASLVLLNAGDRDALVKTAEFFMSQPDPGSDDPHPASMDRARMLLCLDDGYDGKNAADPNCALYLRRTIEAWVRALDTTNAK